jgi:AcrR family transcriptional regulator
MSRQSPADRQASILDASLRMARLHGYQNVTRADIAVAAKCSEALVSSYFGTMVQVRRAVMRAAIKTHDLQILAQGLAARDPHAMRAPEDLRLAAVKSLVA